MMKDPKNKSYQAQFRVIKGFKEQDDLMELNADDDDSSSDSSLPSSNFEDSDEESEEEKGEPERKPRKVGYKKVKVYKHILDPSRLKDELKAPKPRNASMNANLIKKSVQKKS